VVGSLMRSFLCFGSGSAREGAPAQGPERIMVSTSVLRWWGPMSLTGVAAWFFFHRFFFLCNRSSLLARCVPWGLPPPFLSVKFYTS